MKSLLDTNAAIRLMNDSRSPVARQARRHAPYDIGVSTIVLHELFYGAYKGQRSEWSVAKIETLSWRSLILTITMRVKRARSARFWL